MRFSLVDFLERLLVGLAGQTIVLNPLFHGDCLAKALPIILGYRRIAAIADGLVQSNGVAAAGTGTTYLRRAGKTHHGLGGIQRAAIAARLLRAGDPRREVDK
jgi:hypothetical protein